MSGVPQDYYLSKGHIVRELIVFAQIMESFSESMVIEVLKA
jgi:hypothetical protein